LGPQRERRPRGEQDRAETDWSYDYNRKLAVLAENSGFDYALSQVRYMASYGAEFQHESTTFSLSLLLATERLKVIAAIHPGFGIRRVGQAHRDGRSPVEWTHRRERRERLFKGEFTALASHGSNTTSATAARRNSSGC